MLAEAAASRDGVAAIDMEREIPDTPRSQEHGTSSECLEGARPPDMVGVSRVSSVRSQLSVGRMLSAGRENGLLMAEGAMEYFQSTFSQVCEDEPSVFARECKHFVRLKQKFSLFCTVWLILIGALFCIIGVCVDFSLFEEPTYYWKLMPFFGCLTWALLVSRVALAIWRSPRASDAVGTFTFLAAFLVLHVFVFQQVGINSGGSVYSPAYTAMARRLQAPPPETIKDIDDIYAWMNTWADEWVPETTTSPFHEFHPGWMSCTPVSIWTQRVRRGPCGYLGFGWGQCSSSGELNEDNEMTEPLSLSFTDPISGLTTEKVLPWQSGEFLNFHGEPKQSPKHYGSSGAYQFLRGYGFDLVDMHAATSEGPPNIANRSTTKDLFSRLRAAKLIDADTRIVYLSLTLIHSALHQWISMRVMFEIGVAGDIETSMNLYQGMTPYCTFTDPERNKPPHTFLQDALQKAAEIRSGPCTDNEDCTQLLDELGLCDFECTNIIADDYWHSAMAYFLGLTNKWHFPLSMGSSLWLMALFALVTYLLLEEILQMLLTGKAYFNEVSNYLEVATILDVFLIMKVSIDQQDSTPQNGISWELYTSHILLLQRLCGFACFMWWMRLLNFVSTLHPRMRVLIQTMEKAWLDLVFFCAMFGIVLFAFSITFHIWFASRKAAFHHIGTTFTTLFRGLIGDITATTLLETWDNAIFYMMYVILSMLIMVNVFIAIISASFEAQQQERNVHQKRQQEQVEQLESWILQEPTVEDVGSLDSDVLKVVLWSGRALCSSDWNGLADSYAILGLRVACDSVGSFPSTTTVKGAKDMLQIPVGNRLVTFESKPVQTEVVERSLDPFWGLRATFVLPRGAIESERLELYVKVMDRDHLKKDDWMGKAQVNLNELLGRRGGLITIDGLSACRINAKPSATTWSLGASRSDRKLSDRKVKRQSLKVVKYKIESGFVDVSAVLHEAPNKGDDTDEGDGTAIKFGSSMASSQE